MADYRLPDLNTFEWQRPVAAQQNDPPGSPSEGDRYLVKTAPTGAWIGHASEIAEWNGSAWDYAAPAVGMVVWIADQQLLLRYTTSWVFAGAGYGGTSTTENAIGSGSKTWETQPGLAYQAGARVRVAYDGTHYCEGYVTSYSGSTLVVSVTITTGVGTFSSWTINLAGIKGTDGVDGADGAPGSVWYSGTGPPASGLGIDGDFYLNDANGNVYRKASGSWSVIDNLTGPAGANGANGPGYYATSSSSLAIGTGSKTFTTQSGLAYAANMRVRIAYNASNYMEGVCTSYSGTSLVVNVDRVVGSGTYASWTIGLAGDVGATGQGFSDGDKGDITIGGSGTTLTIDNDTVTYAKMQNVSATDKVLGRASAGAGDPEEIACTAAGRALIDDADAATQRTTLGLAIGSNVQAYDATLTSLAAVAGVQGDILYASGADTWTRLAKSSTANSFLKNSGVSNNPAWSVLAPGDMPFAATDRLLGRSSAGAGGGEEIACTAAGRALIDDANAAAQATTLGLGTGNDVTFNELLSGALVTFMWQIPGNNLFAGDSQSCSSLIVPFPVTFLRARAVVATAPTGAAIKFQLTKSNINIFNESPDLRLQIAAGSTSGTATDFSGGISTAVAGDLLNINVDQIGSAIAGGGGCCVILVCKKTGTHA
jgi:hypothetical protein